MGIGCDGTLGKAQGWNTRTAWWAKMPGRGLLLPRARLYFGGFTRPPSHPSWQPAIGWEGGKEAGEGHTGAPGTCVNVFMCRCMSLSRHRVGWRHSALALPSKSTPPLDEWGSTRIGHSLCLQCSGTERRGKPRSRSYCPPHLFIGLYKPGNPLLKTVPCPLYIGDLGLWERLLV